MYFTGTLFSVESINSGPVHQRLKRDYCEPDICNCICQRLEYTRGACVNNECKCDDV